MKIQVVKKATTRTAHEVICPYFVDVPMEKKS
jgi:hypothetical protein